MSSSKLFDNHCYTTSMVNVWTRTHGYGDLFFLSLVKHEDEFYQQCLPVKHRGVGHVVFEIIRELISERAYTHAKENCTGCSDSADMGIAHTSGCLKWYEEQIEDYLKETLTPIKKEELEEISDTVVSLLSLDTHDINYYIQIGLEDISPLFLKIQVEQWDFNLMSLINQTVSIFLKK